MPSMAKKKSPARGIGARIRALMDASADLKTQMALAKRSGVGQTTIGRILRDDTTNPGAENLRRLAGALGTSVEYLLFGDDTRVTAVVRDERAPYRIDATVPVFPLLLVEDWIAGARPTPEETLVSPVDLGPRAFAVRVTGRSMEPRFSPGDIAFADPDVPPAAGRFVVVVPSPASEAVIREISVEGGERYLSAVNPAWPGERLSPLGPEAIIAGTIVGKWVEI